MDIPLELLNDIPSPYLTGLLEGKPSRNSGLRRFTFLSREHGIGITESVLRNGGVLVVGCVFGQ